MVDRAPRDLGDWMRSIERRVMSAQRAASSIPLSYNESLKEDILADTVRHPAAPVEITYQSALYTEAGLARPHARIAVDFPDVTKATDGTDIPIMQYELWGRDDSTNYLESSTSAVAGVAAPGLTFPGLAATPAQKEKAAAALGPWKLLSTSPVSSLVHSGMIPGAIWTFKVRALGQYTVAPGAWSAEFQAQLTQDTTPPPQPTAPELISSRGTITVKWDGLSVGGAMPADFSHVIVAAGTSSSPTAPVASFYRGGGLTVLSGLDYYVPHFVRFQAVDQSGNRGPWSEQATAYVVPLVDEDVILSEIDAAQTLIRNIGAESLLDGAVLADKLADNAVTQAKLADNAITLAKLDSAVSNSIAQGISDSYTANSAALAADTKAGTAQTAATAARARADAIIAAGANLVTNGGFEFDDVWPVNAAQLYDTAEKRSGARSMKLVPASGNVYPTSDWVDGATDRSYRVQYWIKRSGEASVASAVGAVFQCKTTAGGTATMLAYPSPIASSLDISTTDFTKVTVDYTVTTANTVQVRFAPWVRQSTNVYWVDDITVTDITEAKAALDAAQAAQDKADQAFADAAQALEDAGLAQSSANGKNNVYYLPALPSGTGFADGDTVFIRAAEGQPYTGQYRWDKPALTWQPQTIGHQAMASVDLGKATVGELDGIYIKAKSLLADKLLISQGANLFTDPTVKDAAGWANSPYFDPAGGKNGGGSILIPSSAVQNGAYYAQLANLSQRRTRLVPGGTYRLGGWVRTSTAAPASTVQLYLRIQNEDSTTGAIAANVANNSPLNRADTVANVWTFISGLVTVPEDTTYTTGVLGVFKQAGYTTGAVRWSDLSIQQAVAGELIVDGSVNAAKVNAQSVAGAVGQFIELDVSQLNASAAAMDQATIDKLWADVVRSKKITTDMLVVSGENLMPNGFGQNGDNTSWSAWGFDAADKPSEAFGSFTVSTQTVLYLANDALAPKVEEDSLYILEGWIKASVTGSRVFIEAMESGGTNPVPVYPLNSYAVPTVWTKFSVPVRTAVGNTNMSFRMYANHSAGTVFNATQKLAGVRYYKQNGASLIAAGGIATTHLATDSVTAAKIKALEIAAGHLAANAVEADKIKAGAVTAAKLEATLALVTRLIAGPVNGTHAEMDPNGFKVYANDPADGIPNEVARMGVASSDDYFAIMKANGEPAATISGTGIGSFTEVNANENFYYRGDELTALLDAKPRGVVAAAFRTSNSSPDAAPGGAFQPYLRLEATLHPGRLYKIWTSPVRVNIDQGIGCTVSLGFTSGATLATVANASPFTQGFVQPNSNGGRDSVTLQELFAVLGSTPLQYSILLMFGVQETAGGTTGTAGIRADGYHPVRLVIEDVGLNTSSIANGVWLNGTVAPAPAKNTYVKQYGCSNSMNYQGSNAQYAFDTGHMYQGLSPAGYGNLKSIGLFGDMTADLSGATINYIRVYFNFAHWYNNAGGTARIGIHGHTGLPASFSHNGVVATSGGWPKPGARWVDIPSAHWAGFKSGAYRGVSLEGDGTYNTYGYADRPTIQISYTK